MVIIGLHLIVGKPDEFDFIITKQQYLNRRLQNKYNLNLDKINLPDSILEKLYKNKETGLFLDFNSCEYIHNNPVDSLKSLNSIFKSKNNLLVLEF